MIVEGLTVECATSIGPMAARRSGVHGMADILYRAEEIAHRQDAPREFGVGRPVLLAIALGFACVGLRCPLS